MDYNYNFLLSDKPLFIYNLLSKCMINHPKIKWISFKFSNGNYWILNGYPCRLEKYKFNLFTFNIFPQ